MKKERAIVLLSLAILLVSPVSAEATDHAVGDTLVYTIMVSDSQKNFDQNMRDTVKHHMGRVIDYYESRAPSEADLNMEAEYHEATVSYNGDYKSDSSHVTKSLNDLGYSGSYREAIPQLRDEKSSEGYDNLAVLLVAPQEGRSYMRPSGDAEFTTVYYYSSKDALSQLLQMEDTPSVVYAHELGHIFGGEDEYQEEGNTAYGERSYFPASPTDRLYPSFNYENGPSVEESVMATYSSWDQLGWFNIDTPFSAWAKGMIGWRDFDLDGTLDPNDEKIPVRFPEERLPILNAGIDTDTQVKYTEFDEVEAESQYDDASLVGNLGFRLQSPRGETVDQETVNATSYQIQSAELESEVPDSQKPGNWTVEFLYGDYRSAWYEIEVIAPLIQLSTSEVDFGRVNVDESASGQFEVQNQGKMILELEDSEINTGEEIMVEPSDFEIGAMSSGTKSISLSPSETGSIDGQISFDTNDPRQETVSLSFTGFAYAIRHLLASSPQSAKVDEQIPVSVEIEETGEGTDGYNLEVKRGEQTVTDEDFVQVDKQFGTAQLRLAKYGNYTVSVDKPDIKEYEYEPDTAQFRINRLVKNFDLNLEVNPSSITAGESVEIVPKANGKTVSATLYVDGKKHDQGKSFSVKLEEAGKHSLGIEKNDLKTDKQIRKYNSAEAEINVKKRSGVNGILHFLFNLF